MGCKLNVGLVPEHGVADFSEPLDDLDSQFVAGRLEDTGIDDILDYPRV